MHGFFFLQLLTGLATAAQLFLLAAGLTVIFGVTRVVNFAHGSLYMLGAYLGYSLITRAPPTPVGFALGALATAAIVAALGAALEIGLLRRLYRAPDLFQLLATFAVALMAEDLTQRVWGAEDLALPRPGFLAAAVRIGAARFPLYDLVLIGLGPAVYLALLALFRTTRWGVLVRAATADRDMLACLGVDQRWLFTGVFALGAGLAGLGGALGLPDATATLQMGFSSVTDAFVVVVVGGLGSLSGAALASLLIGLLQAFGIALVPRSTLVLVFVVMAVALVLRPHGLLGRVPDETGRAAMPDLIRPATPALRALALAALLAALALPFVAGPFLLSVATEALIALLFAASLHLMMGPGGMASFGHAAWFGLGAYGAALAALALRAPLPLALVMGMLLAGAVAALFGLVVVRLAGVYLAMLTLAFAQIVWAGAMQFGEISGGDNGLLGVWPPRWLGGPVGFYFLALALCVGGALVLRRALQAPFGYALRGARDAPQRAAAIGLDITRLRWAAFTLAGAAAGLAGALFAFAKGSVFPTYLGLGRSVDALLMVLLGGIGTMSGPFVGAVVYTGLYDALLLATDAWRLVLGAAIVAMVLLFPQGIAGAAARRVRA